MGSLFLPQGIFPTQGSNPGLLHCRWILYQLSHRGSPRLLEWEPIPSPAGLPDPGIKPGSPALQADSLPTELSGKPFQGQWGPIKSLEQVRPLLSWKVFYRTRSSPNAMPSLRQEGPGPWFPSFERPCLGIPAGPLPTGEESVGPEDVPTGSPLSSPLPDHTLGNWDLIPESSGLAPAAVSQRWAILTVSVLGFLAKIKWWLRRKAPVYNVGDLGSIPGWGSSLEKETATHSSILA